MQMTKEEQQAYYAKREQKLLDACRVYDHYDRYLGQSVYQKLASASGVTRNAFIVFRFTKRTDT